MGVRMSRSPGGKSSKEGTCKFGDTGDRGMGAQFSGWQGNDHKSRNKLSWKDPGMTKARMGNSKGWASMPDRWNTISSNPSGASNRALKSNA